MVWYLGLMRETGDGIPEMIDAWSINASSTDLAWDLTIASATLIVLGLAEAWARQAAVLLLPHPSHSLWV
jgi:hypothetical protein